MPRVSFLKSYLKAFKKFTKRDKKKIEAVDESLRRFAQDPKHPSFHLEKLSGTKIWTIRVDDGNRMFFVWSDKGDIAIFFHIGSHDSYKTM